MRSFSNTSVTSRRKLFCALLACTFFVFVSIGYAWTGPSQAPTDGNVSAPINVGGTAQTKNGTLGVNGLAVFGNSLLSGSNRYLNFGTIPTPADPSTGYGIRDNAGTLEFKNNSGNWTAFGGGLPWLASGNDIYNTNSANVGIGTASPGQKLHVAGSVLINSGSSLILDHGYTVHGNIRVDSGAGYQMRYEGYYGHKFLTSSGQVVTIAQTGSLTAPSFLYSSDSRLKENIVRMKDGLATIMALNPVSFTWKKDVVNTAQAGKGDIGFIAQEVENVVPGIVTTNEADMKSVDYVRLIPILTKALQEQQAEIDALKADVATLKAAQ